MTCRGGDPLCPCQDGDSCHYAGTDAWPIPDRDWTQSGEQKHIEAFADRFRRRGQFLDIGAFDGVTGSNSRWLALNGWGGVCVEPAAAAFHRLAELYADRNDVLCAQALVDARAGLRTFWYSPTDLVSTTETDHRDLWRKDVRYVETAACAITLADLLVFVGGRFDVVSIDTEGTSLQLLEQLRHMAIWETVGLVVVEFQDGEQEHEIHNLCGRGDWHVCERTANNVVLERLAWIDITSLGDPERTEVSQFGDERQMPHPQPIMTREDER